MTDLLSTREAAETLGISGARVRVLLKDGRVPGAQLIGNSWVIPRASLTHIAPSPVPQGWQKGRPRKQSSPDS